MAEVSHTPGPWRLHINFPDRIVAGGVGINHRFVADCRCLSGSPVYREHFTPPQEEALANARLIAAAPDLYEALKAAQKLAASGPAPLPPTDPRWAQIAAALARAEGK